MVVKETNLKGCFIVQPQIFRDKRGYFIESFNQKTFNKISGLTVKFVQDNESQSSKGVLRGLHFQVGAHAQAKLLRVVKGRVLDVAVDLRAGSKTFGEHFSIELTGDNKTQLFVPRGFAHGFVVLEDDTIFSYKCDNFYNKEAESGIIYNDPTLKIDWQLLENEIIISEKDVVLPKFKDAVI
jgi:dTDP-4-dehydrorhamnose 3,5-epimerase